MPDPTNVQRFQCPQCAADMEFDPESGGMKCSSCGHTEALSSPGAGIVNAHSLEEALARPGGAASKPLSAQAIEVSCGGCGSVVAFEPPEVAGACPFCGGAIVAEPKAADPLIAPDAVLPAKTPKNAAQAQVREWLNTRWFAPDALKRLAQQEGIGGVYLPFWTYAADTQSQYAGQRGEHYWQTETYTERDSSGNNVQRSRQVQHTRWYPAAGQVSRSFQNVLIAATKAVKESRLNALQPWDLEALCPYEPAYLAGFKAQRYQIELPEGFEKAKAVMAAEIQEDVRKNIGGDEQRIESVQTVHSNVMFRHLLLPVWIGAYRFQGKVYQVVVNARTGEVQGERPYSAAKIALLVVVIIVVLIVIAMLSGKH
jgi:ribosomal protein S27E